MWIPEGYHNTCNYHFKFFIALEILHRGNVFGLRKRLLNTILVDFTISDEMFVCVVPSTFTSKFCSMLLRLIHRADQPSQGVRATSLLYGPQKLCVCISIPRLFKVRKEMRERGGGLKAGV